MKLAPWIIAAALVVLCAVLLRMEQGTYEEDRVEWLIEKDSLNRELNGARAELMRWKWVADSIAAHTDSVLSGMPDTVIVERGVVTMRDASLKDVRDTLMLRP